MQAVRFPGLASTARPAPSGPRRFLSGAYPEYLWSAPAGGSLLKKYEKLPSPQPRVKGSRVPPVSSTQIAFSSRYSSMAWMPFSRPSPEFLNPPKGTEGATAR